MNKTATKISNGAKKGVTLIEMVIAIAIIGIMATATVFSLNENKNAKQAEVAAREVAASIRQVQNSALNGKQDGGNPLRKICGYGFYFANALPNEYKFFYNYTDNAGDCAAISRDYNAEAPTYVFETKTFQGGTVISAGMETSAIYFDLPFTNVSYNGAAINAQKIILQSGSAYYTVCVYARGDVQEKSGDVSCN